MAHAQCAGSVFENARRLRLRSCLRLPHFILFLRSITRPLAREEERLTHITELACGRSEVEEGAQEREKNGTSGVHGGGYFAPHGTNNIFLDFGFDFYFGFLFTYEVLEHLRTAHHLPDGRLASRGALAELFLFIPRPHSF
jgi:hypothetical protein